MVLSKFQISEVEILTHHSSCVDANINGRSSLEQCLHALFLTYGASCWIHFLRHAGMLSLNHQSLIVVNTMLLVILIMYCSKWRHSLLLMLRYTKDHSFTTRAYLYHRLYVGAQYSNYDEKASSSDQGNLKVEHQHKLI